MMRSYGQVGDDTGLGILDLCCPLGFEVAAVKTRLQDFFALHPLVASHPLGKRFLVLKPLR